MAQQNIDPLSLYAGLNITIPATGITAPVWKIITNLLDRAENKLSRMQPKAKAATLQKQNKTRKEAIL